VNRSEALIKPLHVSLEANELSLVAGYYFVNTVTKKEAAIHWRDTRIL
jgi:hypothetical protein